MLRVFATAVVAMVMAAPSPGQTPQPFPRPGGSPAQPPRVAPPAPPPQAPPPAAAKPAADPNVPTEATLGAAVYPAAQFLASYDAGRGQRYYVFGATASYVDVVGYYTTQTGKRGELVFKDPPTHMFLGEPFARFREETMVFPPGVTVKDWTAGGSQGYPNPKPGAQPVRYPTIIMIVPPPPAAAASPR